MNRRAPASAIILLAFVSGIPALVYEVVWTRQVGLLAGGQIGAISVVLVVFFGGLALGALVFGSLADRSASPLRLYGLLEVAAGLLASLSIWALRGLSAFPTLDSIALLGASALILFPVTVLLGGTLPALLRSMSSETGAAAKNSGVLVGANTVGAVTGVGVAIYSIPVLGLHATVAIAAGCAVVIGTAVFIMGRQERFVTQPRGAPTSTASTAPKAVLAAAFIVGLATLGFEVLATRMASLQLGSSLYAWGFVLALFLTGLSLGNFAVSGRAQRTMTPALDLGLVEVAAAFSVVLGVAVLRPNIASASANLGSASLASVAFAVLPATFFMGAAFPLLVRLAVHDHQIGATFGRLSAVNTLGGIAGALLAPFFMLPLLGSVTAGLCFAAANALVGLAFVMFSESARLRRRAFTAIAFLTAASFLTLRPSAPANEPWVLFVSEGYQATAIVTGFWGDRTLIVDGDPEASTTGLARRTEETLAILPILLHPNPERFLEIGFGSGITLGTAARFDLEQIDCVEIADSVLQAAVFFEPDNGGVSSNGKATVIRADARRLLVRRPKTYDIISANTLHPWSVGSTGLYSQEYFSRIAAALRPNGIAVQWLPVERIGADSLTIILRTFFDVFPEGGLWWGAGNIIAVGSLDPIVAFQVDQADARLAAIGFEPERLGWKTAKDLPLHQIGDAAAVRASVGAGDLLRDDRPLLELYAARNGGPAAAASVYDFLVAIAKQNPGTGAMLFWLESLKLRVSHNVSGANSREVLASSLGLSVAEEARRIRHITAVLQESQAGDLDAAFASFSEVLKGDPAERMALFARAGISIQRGDPDSAIRDLQAIVVKWSEDIRAWNELANVLAQRGELKKASSALEKALTANPYDLRTLANAGLIAVSLGDRPRAGLMLARIRNISPLGQSDQERSLLDAFAKINTN